MADKTKDDRSEKFLEIARMLDDIPEGVRERILLALCAFFGIKTGRK